MAGQAILVIDAPSRRLLWGQPELRVGLRLGLGTREQRRQDRGSAGQLQDFPSELQTHYYGGPFGVSPIAVNVLTKRVYEKPSLSDGARVLVDRLWPRGVSKNAAKIDAWLRDLAPSDKLRKWYHARPTQWLLFRKRYLQELNSPEATKAFEELCELASKAKTLTLIFASRNEEQNNATVLRDLLNGMRKPPSSSGPARAAAGGRIRRSAPRR